MSEQGGPGVIKPSETAYHKGPIYSDGPLINKYFDGVDTQKFINSVRDGLLGANWKVLSKIFDYPSTIGYKMECFDSPYNGTKMRVKIFWDEQTVPFFGYPIVKFTFSDHDEKFKSELHPGLITIEPFKQFHMYAGPHQCFIEMQGPHDFDHSGKFEPVGSFHQNNIAFGMPAIRDTSATDAQYWACWDGNEGNFRYNLVPNGASNYCFLINGVFKKGETDSDIIYPQFLTYRSTWMLDMVPIDAGEVTKSWPMILPWLVTGIQANDYVTAVPIWDAFIGCLKLDKKIYVVGDNRIWENYTAGCEFGTLFLVAGTLQPPLVFPGYSY